MGVRSLGRGMSPRRQRGGDDDKRARARSAVRARKAPEIDSPPTRVEPPRPPRRSLLEGDEHNAPTKLKRVVTSVSDDEDDLTRVKSPADLMKEAEAAQAAPTKIRRAPRRPASDMPSPLGDDDEDEPPDSLPPPAGHDDLEGTMIGQCQVGPVFASGGMATVHLGRWRGGGGFSKTVAVKRLHQNYAAEPDFVSMLLDEARVVARIQHGNVASVLDVVEGDAELFIVMDFVNGVTLAHLMRQMQRKKETIPIPVAMRIVSGILHGLQAAHDATDEQGNSLQVIHRDVSPENVLVGVDGSVQLIDFGVARALGRITQSVDGQIKGKLRYSSPEQLRGEPLDAASDIYAASIVLWEVACGRRLYQGENAGAVIWEILESTPPLPSLMRDGLSEAFDEIVLRGLNPDAKGRWLSAADMAEAIERTGPVATQREVGDWVKAVAPERLARLRDTLKRTENMAPPASLPPTSSRPAPTSAAPPAREAAPSSTKRGMGMWLGIIAIVAVLATVLGFLFGRGDDAPETRAVPQPPEALTVLVSVPVPVPVEAPPPKPTQAAPAPVPYTPRTPFPRRPKPRPKPKPKGDKDWIPEGI